VRVTTIPEPDVRAELDRILASKGFATAGRLSKLLRYVVERTLAGETDQLKEYAVGIEVFERDEKYDPRLDSIVRVEAGRLRTKLDEYYNGEGSSSPIRISLPRGGYSAVFERPAVPAAPLLVEVAAPHPRRSRLTIPLTVGLLCAIAAMVVWLGGWNRRPKPDLRPSVAVLAFATHVAGEEHERLAAHLTDSVTTELARLGTVSVASHTSAMQFAGQRGSLKEISAALNARYIVEASLDQDEQGQLLVVARIVNGETDRKMWVGDYRGAKDDTRGIAQRMAFEISTAILERYKQSP